MLSLLAIVALLGRARPRAAVPTLAGVGGSRGTPAATPTSQLPSAFWEGVLRGALPQLAGRPGRAAGLEALLRAAAPREPPAAAAPARRRPAADGGRVPAANRPPRAAARATAPVSGSVPAVAARGPAARRRAPTAAPAPGTTVCGDKPVVLVYQTHAEESFVPALGSRASAGGALTDDRSKSVVRVGDELASALCTSGVSVVHLRTGFDMEGRIGAYLRSLDAERAAMKRWPSLRVLLDVHRDVAPRAATTAVVDGLPTARVLIVVGTDATLPEPSWRQNAAWAARVHRALEASYPGLARTSAGRPYFAGDGRFNQQLGPAALLFEIGGQENTMAEELRGARLLGRTLAGLIQAGEYPK